MGVLRWAAGALIALIGGSWAAAAPLEAYGKLPFIESAAIAPDGSLVAYAVTDGEKRNILIKNVASGKIVGGLRGGEHKIRAIQWAGPNHLIITASVTGYIPFVTSARAEWYVAIDYNVARKSETGLLSNVKDPAHPNDTLNVIYGDPQVRYLGGHPFIFVEGTMFEDGEGRLALFKIDLDHGGASQIVSPGYPHTDDFVVGPHGDAVAESEYDGHTARWTLKVMRNYHWAEVTREGAPIERPTLMGLAGDGNSILVRFHSDKGDVLRTLSPDGRTWGEPSPAPDDLIWEPSSGRLIGQADMVGDEGRYSFLDPKDQAAWAAVKRAYAGAWLSLRSFSEDHRKLIVEVDSPTDGPAYAFVDLDARRGDWIAEEYPALFEKDISPRQAIAFKASDGLDLTGYLTLPNGRPAKGLPLVVLPHGGPALRDQPGWDWWAQALASRGYAVLQVNYRGSDGFGWALLSAGFGQWGRKMQTDLSDGVRWLAAKGTIDPARVCIFGGSYGGYAALAGAAIDRGVYRCAIAVAGISDLKRMINWDRSNAGDEADTIKRYWLRYMGPEADLASISPLQQAANVAIPVLLIHGKDDTVVAYDQSQIMADALARAGKKVEFVTLNKEDHWLSHGETRLQMLQAGIAFLEKYNPPN